MHNVCSKYCPDNAFLINDINLTVITRHVKNNFFGENVCTIFANHGEKGKLAPERPNIFLLI